MATKSKVQGATTTPGTAYHFKGDDITALRVSPQQVRFEGVDEAHVKDLARRIASEGQLQPALIRIAGDGKPEIVDGRHRHAAIMLINANLGEYKVSAPIPFQCTLKVLSDEDVIGASLEGNSGKPPTAMDLATAVKNFRNQNHTGADIARKLSTPFRKVSQSYVSRLEAFNRLPHDAQAMLHSGKLPENAATALLQMEKPVDELNSMCASLVAGELTPAEITAMARNVKRDSGKVVKRTIRDVYELYKDNPESLRLFYFTMWLDGKLGDDDIMNGVEHEGIIIGNVFGSCHSCGYDTVVCGRCNAFTRNDLDGGLCGACGKPFELSEATVGEEVVDPDDSLFVLLDK